MVHGVASTWLVLQMNPCTGLRTRRSSTKLEVMESNVYCSHQSSKISRFAIISGVIVLGRSILDLSNSSTRNLKFRASQCRLSRGFDHIVHFQPLKGDLLHTATSANLTESLHLQTLKSHTFRRCRLSVRSADMEV